MDIMPSLYLDELIKPVRERRFTRTTISIRIDQHKWLRNHREYSISGIVQKVIDEIIKADSQNEKLPIVKISRKKPKQQASRPEG